MSRAWGLVAVWVLFAATAVGVGFTAAGLIEEPRAAAAGPEMPVATTPPAGARRSRAAVPPGQTPSASAQQEGPNAESVGPTAAGEATTAEGSGTPSTQQGPSITKGISTVGGYVSGTCSWGVMRMSASPNAGWVLAELSGPEEERAKAEFEQAGQGGAKVEVEAWCQGGKPAFAVDGEDGDSETDDDGRAND